MQLKKLIFTSLLVGSVVLSGCSTTVSTNTTTNTPASSEKKEMTKS